MANQSDPMIDDIDFEEGSGNVFADIGFDDDMAARLLRKAALVGVLRRFQESKSLSQIQLAKMTGIPQPRISALYNGKIAGITTEKLIDAVAKIGAHVSIKIDEHPEHSVAGKVTLEVA